MPSAPKLADLIDVGSVQSMMDDFYCLTRIAMAVLDVDGQVLVGVGWQDICTQFHRVHPESCSACIESDTQLSVGVPPGEFRMYRCKNHMWDVATPIMLRDRHVGNVFSGQFFFEDEDVDETVFREQARRYQFEEGPYLAALSRVPRISRSSLNHALGFFVKLANLLSHLGDANSRLQEADRRKNEFIAVLSHELRNPLAPIRFALPILAAQPLDESGRRSLAVVTRQTDQLACLLRDLLDVTRISSGKIDLRKEHVLLASVISAAVEAAAPAMINRRHTLKTTILDDPLWLQADAPRLTQIVANLLDNSAKYTPPGGEIVLEVRRENADALVSVRDNGIGIPVNALPHVFELFHQVERADKPQGGLGIGLGVVKRLVEVHGGSIEARSPGVGQGSEFVVRLPLARTRKDVAAPRVDAARPETRRRLRVLIVDDNPDLVEMLAIVVEAAGHDVRKALDGRSAVSLAVAYRPHLVLLDLGLPEIDGLEVARELRRRPETTACRLVALTGWGQHEDRQRTREAGFDGHLTKPADPKAVERILAEVAAEGWGEAPVLDRCPVAPGTS